MIKELFDLANAIEKNERKKTFLQSVLDCFVLSSVSVLGVYILQHEGLFIFGQNILEKVPSTVYLCVYVFFAFIFIGNVWNKWRQRKYPRG